MLRLMVLPAPIGAVAVDVPAPQLGVVPDSVLVDGETWVPHALAATALPGEVLAGEVPAGAAPEGAVWPSLGSGLPSSSRRNVLIT